MNADGYQDRVNVVTAEVIGAAHRVSSILGCGFLEKVYENALRIEVERAGLPVQQQHAVDVLFRDQVVGRYLADLVVADTVVIELKAASAFDRVHEAQCINYLRATGLHVCLLLIFGRPRLEVRRIVLGL